MKFVTFHVRLTKDCNAHCNYCSSAGLSQGRMSPAAFARSLDFIVQEVFPRMGIGSDHFLTVEFLGGEVLLVPEVELSDIVETTRNRLRPLVRGYRDGAQSNLIGAPRRILMLHDLFNGNLGTSWDSATGQRHIKGSPQLYNTILQRSLRELHQQRALDPGRVIVLDKHTAPHIEDEVRAAIAAGYDLVIRPVFQGGSDTINPLEPDAIARIMERCYAIWSRDRSARVEPFYSLFQRRASRGVVDRLGGDASKRSAGCPFQSDCTFRSLSLDPDGTLYVCQEMADADHYPLGNALSSTFNDRTWRLLSRRTAHLSSDCAQCRWKEECGGGCMNEAIEAHGDPFAKTELCPAWKAIFHLIEQDIQHGHALPQANRS